MSDRQWGYDFGSELISYLNTGQSSVETCILNNPDWGNIEIFSEESMSDIRKRSNRLFFKSLHQCVLAIEYDNAEQFKNKLQQLWNDCVTDSVNELESSREAT